MNHEERRCIVCGNPAELGGRKGELLVSYCNEHMLDCVEAGAACLCF